MTNTLKPKLDSILNEYSDEPSPELREFETKLWGEVNKKFQNAALQFEDALSNMEGPFEGGNLNEIRKEITGEDNMFHYGMYRFKHKDAGLGWVLPEGTYEEDYNSPLLAKRVLKDYCRLFDKGTCRKGIHEFQFNGMFQDFQVSLNFTPNDKFSRYTVYMLLSHVVVSRTVEELLAERGLL